MKNSKEIYIKPQTEIIDIEAEGVMAYSLRVDEEETVSGSGRANKRIWDEE